MNEAKARLILGNSIRPDNTLYFANGSIQWNHANRKSKHLFANGLTQYKQLEAALWWVHYIDGPRSYE
jgi:hypothetical protein